MNTHNRLHIVGDLHGLTRWISYWNDKHTGSALLHVGDMGVGYWFPSTSPIVSVERQLMLLSEQLAERGNRFMSIRGNHDNPEWYRNTRLGPNVTLLEDNTAIEVLGKKIFCVGGALSVDRHLLTPTIDWWEDERFGWDGSLPEQRPDIVVTHSGGGWVDPQPNSPFMDSMRMNERMHGRDLEDEIQEERHQHNLLLQALIHDDLMPTHWYYGHFHRYMHRKIHGCDFLCLKSAHADGRRPDIIDHETYEYVNVF